jgi:hypothetical protein
VEWLVKLGGALGLTEKIPYQPVGGLKWVRSGFVSKDSPGPLGFGGALRTDYEAFFYFQNLMLLGPGHPRRRRRCRDAGRAGACRPPGGRGGDARFCAGRRLVLVEPRPRMTGP